MLETSWFRNWMRPGAAVGLALAAVSGCEMGDDVDGFSSEDWKLVQEVAPLSTPMPRNPFNNQDQDMAVAKLGQLLFYETDYAEAITVDGPSGKMGEAGKVGCITCHQPVEGSYVDRRPGSQAVSHGRNFLRRNSPTMVNTGWYEWIGWTGRHDSMVMHGSGVMGVSATPLYYAHYIYAKYKAEYEMAFPNHPLDPALDPMHPDAMRFPKSGGPKANAMAPDGPWEKMTPEDRKAIMRIQANLGRVWDTYPRMLVTRDSPFEKYTKGDYKALTPGARRGLELFIGKAACNDCHNGPLLSDNKFHNIGVPTPPNATPDMGRFPDMAGTLTHAFNAVSEYSDNVDEGKRKHMRFDPKDESMTGAFRTPMLVHIEKTGPYFHTGLFNTLEDVVRFYNRGGGEPGTFPGKKDPRLVPLQLTEAEIADLVEFLKSLTGNLPDQEWVKDIRKDHGKM